MESNKKTKLISLAVFLGIGYLIFKKMSEPNMNNEINSNMLEWYGAKSISEIKDAITETASNYRWGADFTNLYNALFEIVAVESDFGHAKDTTKESGEGLTQFDKTTFNELYQKAQAENKMPREFYNLTYYDLRKNPRFSLFMARYFLYKRVPHAIPNSVESRAKDWKKYYNTIYGKGTESHYISQNERWKKYK